MVIAIPPFGAVSAGEAAAFAPACSSGAALFAVRFQTRSAWPASSRRRAMPWPIAPSPMNPIVSAIDPSPLRPQRAALFGPLASLLVLPGREYVGMALGMPGRRAGESTDARETNMKPEVTSFFHEDSSTICHVVREPGGTHAAIIDAALDFDEAAGRTRTEFADRVIAFVREQGLVVDWILETHAHADHLSAAPYLRQQLGGRIGIGEHIADVQRLFRDLFNVERTFNTDGSQFDHLFEEGEHFSIGALDADVLYTPGHTPACVTYVIGDAAFVGDTLFMPDGGTARADFPGGDARTLYRSIEKILALPGATRLFVCHDYGPGGRAIAWETTVAEQRARNIHVHEGTAEAEFVKVRTERDQQLKVPKLLIPSIQVNMRAGELPPPEDNGVSYIKIPLNRI
jgi:glyoxylase-like metal-dependent hydrolase (beta-lactamase superfamily II)